MKLTNLHDSPESKLKISHSIYPESDLDFNTFWENLKNRTKPNLKSERDIKIKRPLGFLKISHYKPSLFNN